jgi:hypothetical protein
LPIPEQESSTAKAGKTIVLFLLIGAVVGFVMGYISWIVYGQIQMAAGFYDLHTAFTPPPTFYLLVWTALGAVSFAFAMSSLLKRGK